MDSIDVSVIIPAYNAQAVIARVLDALARQDYPKPYEVIVVDDGSIDKTAQIVQGYAHVRYAYQANAGPASARNHGARLARGHFLALTDADCIPHVDWLSQLMRGFNAEDTAVVAGSYGIANGSSLLARCIHQEIIFRHTRLMPDWPKAFGSYNFCVRKNSFNQVGGFNTEYRRASGEDNDLSYKIIEARKKIYFNRKALVDHFHPTLIGVYLKEQFRHGLWRVKMYADHPAMAQGDGYTFWKDILEVPWSLLCLLSLSLSALGVLSLKAAIVFLILPFMIFEVLSASFMMHSFFCGIFFGFITFCRAFVRSSGLSTGILLFFLKKSAKKVK